MPDITICIIIYVWHYSNNFLYFSLLLARMDLYACLIPNEGGALRVTPCGLSNGWEDFFYTVSLLPKKTDGDSRGLHVSRRVASQDALTSGVEKIIADVVASTPGDATLEAIGKSLVQAGYTVVNECAP
ncbi:hypothetical protein HYV82_04045 [Candidatus Woesearchaeota archaeon]|nr:hypothetical protein [Candidatus Woesearchaeota archaeon]